MTNFKTELSGSVLFQSGNLVQASLVPGINALALTGSFNITGSQLTFNGSDVIGRIEAIESGLVASGSLLPLNQHSQSVNAFTSSTNSFTASYYNDSASFDTRIKSLDTDITSLESSVDSLTSSTSSYYSSVNELTAEGFITSSASNIISSSQQIEDLGFVTSATVDVPAGTVSSSAQISNLGFITASESSSFASTASYIHVDNIDGTIALSISSSYSVTASYIDPTFISASAAAAGFGDAVLPAGTISSSQQIEDLGYLTSASAAALGFGEGGISTLPSGTVSSSAQIVDLLVDESVNFGTGEVTASRFSGDGSGLTNLTLGQVNSVRTDFSNTGSLTIQHNLNSQNINVTTYDVLGYQFLPSSVQLLDNNSVKLVFDSSSSGHSVIAVGGHIFSGSATSIDTGSLVSNTDFNSFTSSYLADSASFDSRILNITASSGGDTSYNGNRVVSNTLLGDLYTDSFNAGTTGSIQNFLDALFFPTTAPTATFTNQTAVFNANQATSGTNLVSVSITDTVDESPYTLTLSGTGASSLTAVPTNAASSSWELRAGSNLTAGTYTYNVTVGDNGGSTRTYENRTISIAAVDSGTLSTNGTFYIIESATSGPIYLNSSGRTGTQGRVTVSYSPNYGSQVASNFQSSNPLIDINSNGYLLLGGAISGSGNVSGDVLTSTISWEDQYGNADSSSINVNVTTNNAPTINESNSSILNTNQATSGSTLVTVSFSDPEGDAINYDSYTFTQTSGTGTLEAVRNNTVFLIRPTSDLTAGSYSFTSTVTDTHGFNTRTANHSFSIAQADDGTLTGDTNIYIIESALNGSVFRDATGYNNGNPAQVSVSYSPNYGSQSATYTSSNAAVVIDSSGNLTLGVDLSGSLTQSGDTILSTITWNDQYGNTDSSVVTATVFANQSPSATFTDSELDTGTAISGSTAGTLSITDTESNSPFSVSIGGTSGSLFNAVPQNAASSSWQIQPTGSLVAGSYPITAIVSDNYSKQAIVNGTITVSEAITDTLYVYDVGQISSTYVNDLGIQSAGGGTVPTTATSYNGFGFLEKIEDGALGSSSFTYSWGDTKTATLLATGSGANANSILTSLGAFSKTNNNRFVIFMPSGSNMSGVPRSMTDGYGGSTTDEYVLEVAADGGSIGGGLGTTEASGIHKVILGSAVNGVTNYIMVGNLNTIASSTSIELRIIPSSGSAT